MSTYTIRIIRFTDLNGFNDRNQFSKHHFVEDREGIPTENENKTFV